MTSGEETSRDVQPVSEEEFRSDLQALAILISQLHDIEDPAIHVTYDQAAGHPTTTPAGSRLAATELLDKAHINLATLARILNIPGPEYPDHQNQATWHTDIHYARQLATHPGLALTPCEMQLFAQETHWIVTRARELTNPPQQPSIIIGPCPNPQCGHTLRGNPGDHTTTCPHCHNTWKTNTIRNLNYHKLLNNKHSQTCTATQSAHILKACGITISPSTIRTWKQQGTITPNGTNQQGQPTYALADIFQRVSAKQPGSGNRPGVS